MDQKSWLWGKKSAEKTIASTEKNNPSFKRYEEQPELENDYLELNNKVSYAISDCDTKDDLLRKHERIAQEAIAGREKAESEATSLKKQLDESFKQRIASEERIVHLDLALKECTQQLRFVREDQEQRIHGEKTLKEFEKSQLLLEEKLQETGKRLAKAVIENAHLSQTLLTKEKLVEDLRRQRGQVEADFNLLVSRLDSMEKENGTLKYEVRVLEKEIEIRNGEREFNRRTTDVSHKQHLESVKKIARLETECQRLRVLVKKRLPVNATIAKMKNEAEVLEFRKKSSVVEFGVDRNVEIPASRISSLLEQLVLLGEENKNLRESASTRMSHEMLVSDMGSDDRASSAESWVSGKFGFSDISLMDDFAEMERLAVFAADETSRSQLSFTRQSLTDAEAPDSVDALVAKLPSSLQRILEMVMKHERDPDELLPEIKIALEPKIPNKQDPQMNKSLSKIIELIEGINFPSQKDLNLYTVRVFQWKSSELYAIMQRFLHTCYDLLTEKTELSKFAEELGFALDWILNHCFSLQDVTSMREEIMNWDDRGIKEEKMNVEETLRSQCEDLESTVERLRNEMEELKDSKKAIECQIENYRTENADLDRELSLVKAEANEARENLSFMEAELENKSSVYEELENTCFELQLQLESVKKSEIPSSDFPQEHKPQTDWEITAASEKLAECQETILNLGKQLKALASPKEAALFDKVVPSTVAPGPSQRASLLDQMLAEDNAKAKIVNGKQPLKGDPEPAPGSNGLLQIQENKNMAKVLKTGKSPVGSLAIVPVKSWKSSGLWRKLLWKKRKESSKTPQTM